MIELAALSPTFAKGIVVTACALILFVGSVYVLLAALLGRTMGYFVLATSFFGWMIVLSSLWAIGAPGTLRDLGPRGTEPHWQVFAAAPGPITTKYPETSKYPSAPWDTPKPTNPSVSSLTSAIQNYLAAQAQTQLHLPPTASEVQGANFVVQNVAFASSGHTSLAAAQSFFSSGGPAITVFAYHDSGNVPVFSLTFLAASILGFALHLPFLDRLEKSRKEILTGGTAPPWYGPA
jgi:hypothetical protein